MLPTRWQVSMMLLIAFLSDALVIQWNIRSIADGQKLLNESVQSEDMFLKNRSVKSIDETRILLSFTSLADTQYCVANSSADITALTLGLNWVCGPGMANCNPIQAGQPCYVANNVAAVASYAYNDYYQKNKASGGTCNFNNTAYLTSSDPSHGSCIFTGSSGTITNTSNSTTNSTTTVGSPSTNNTGGVTDLANDAFVLQMRNIAYLLPVLLFHICLKI